jgi:hypothetical protein
MLGIVAAYSYSGLFLTRVAIKYSGKRTIKAAIFKMGMTAAQFGARVNESTFAFESAEEELEKLQNVHK